MLTIAFDGICLGDGPVTGVGRAFLNALAAYAAGFSADCVLLLPPGARDPELAGVRTVAAPRGALRRQLALPRLLRTLGADVVHSSVAAVPLAAPCAKIATVHDVPWLHPEAGERTPLRRRFATVRALRRATAIVAPSTMSCADARRLLGARSTPVVCVPNVCASGPAPAAGDATARRGPLLVLGDDRPRKNRDRLRRAHAIAAAQRPELPSLAFVGPPDHYVTEPEKRALLASCRALVHVALFEGFGMPVLEALAHGAPVVCADLPPLREVAGAHALYVDPRDVDAIAAALVHITTDAPLRERLARDGHARARDFAPHTAAARWHALHREIAG